MKSPLRHARGFTLIELLVSMAVLSILMLLVSSVLSQVQQAWGRTAAKVSQFREARRAFDVMKNNLSQAVLNTYLRYEFANPTNPATPFDASGNEIANSNPTRYVPYSELQFRCGPATNLVNGATGIPQGHAVFFQAPIGYSGRYTALPTALNARGFFVQFGSDQNYRPDFLTGRVPLKYRYRLMQYAPPTERNIVYDQTTATVQSDWFRDDVAQYSRPIADNVLALILSPRRPTIDSTGDPRDIAPQYTYDSSVPMGTNIATNPQAHVLPPAVEILMVVIDEGSARQVSDRFGTSVPIQVTGFTNANTNQFRADVENLEQQLVDAKVNFRIFNAIVVLRNSKWNG